MAANFYIPTYEPPLGIYGSSILCCIEKKKNAILVNSLHSFCAHYNVKRQCIPNIESFYRN